MEETHILDQIMDAVCEQCECSPDVIRGVRRGNGRTRCRAIFYYIARVCYRLSIAAIANYTNTTDRTIFRNIRIATNLQSDWYFKNDIMIILNELNYGNNA